MFDLVVIGGGAAGFFAAIRAVEMNPALRILILEKSNKLLSKVKVSGGGRCNVTHHCFNPNKLAAYYPRGGKQMKKLFQHFHAKHVVDWFASKGLELKTEADGRMFPVTDNSQTIIDCFLQEAEKHHIKINMLCGVNKIEFEKDNWKIYTEQKQIIEAKKVLVATGGSAKPEGYQWLSALGLKIVPPIPSLFTFNDSAKHFKDLMGLAVPNAEVKIAGTKFSEQGALLITHWGLSGPAVIKLSAWAAKYFYEQNYTFTALVSWIGAINENDLRATLLEQKQAHPKRKIYNDVLFDLPSRLWIRLCERAEIPAEKVWGELAMKNLNKLIEQLMRCTFHIKGKTTFKEEFVTCGGVDWDEVDLPSMQSKNLPGLYFAGEILDVDGVTGGFNFQSAWTTAEIAARHIAR
ncbi:MAG TPA: NAD(P)/FAD-dependent oxidoreductase [Cyclobacteriaceae bacterium]|nr:NAD(P)/FAD-dependent oxidoreductase [Cyclobacteriaceae bacterium]